MTKGRKKLLSSRSILFKVIIMSPLQNWDKRLNVGGTGTKKLQHITVL